MPGQTQVSFLAKQGKALMDAHKETKGAPPKVGNAGLPGGIEAGTAELSAIKFDHYKEGNDKGQPYFSASGIVREPKEFNGVTIAGLRTQIGPEPIFNTPGKSGKRKTFSDHYDWVTNQIKLLAGPEWCKQLDAMPCQTQAECEALETFILQTMKALANAKPPIAFHFRTSTLPKQVFSQDPNGKWWVGNGNGRGTSNGPYPNKAAAKLANPYAVEPDDKTPAKVYHEWNGAFAYSAPETLPDIQDETGAESNGEAPPETPEPAADNGEDLAALAATADADPDNKTAAGQAANRRLNEAANAAGIGNDTLATVGSWAEVVAMMNGQASAGGDDEGVAADEDEEGVAADEGPPDPVQGGIVGYQRKGAKAPAQFEVATVNNAARTVTLKFTDGKNAGKKLGGTDGKALPVSWDDLKMD